MWLLGTAALLVGYVLQAAALDRGRLAIIQPLLVMTIVFALPLGYFLTGQHVGRKEIAGAAVIVLGLARSRSSAIRREVARTPRGASGRSRSP